LYTNHHRIIRRFHSYISIETCSSAFQIEKNDILFAGSGETITEIGKSAAYISDEIAYAGSDMLVFRPNDMDGTYLGYLMNSQLVRQQLNKYGTGATVIHIYQDDLKKIKVPDMPRVEQIKIGKYFEVFAQNIKNAESKVSLSKSLQKSLINQVF
jgi:restriction endonuclease S subunit